MILALRILFLRRKGEGGLGAPAAFHEFEQAVSLLADCKHAGMGWPLYRPNETIDQTVRRLYGNDPPDWVIDRERCEVLPRPRRYRVAAYVSDLHAKGACKIRSPQAHLEYFNRIGLDALFMRYKYITGAGVSPNIFVKGLKVRWFFLPWSVDPEGFKPLEPKRYDVTFIGASHQNIYPLRHRIVSELSQFCKARGLRCLKRFTPPGRIFEFKVAEYQNHPSIIVGKKYKEALGYTRFFIFGHSKYGYPLQKDFEGASAECANVADEVIGGEELGFVDGKTYIKINPSNWKEKLAYYAENEGLAREIGRAARQLILKRHTHELRARQFIKILGSF